MKSEQGIGAGGAAPDTELALRAKQGDKDAYRSLVERYQKRVLRLAYELLKSKEDAEDLAQEAFVKAYLSIADFQGRASFYTWIYRIIFNMAIDYKRKLSRRGGVVQEFDEALMSGVDAGSVPEDQILRKEQAKYIRQALDNMTEEHRVAIVLRELDGLSYDEIAEVLGVSKGTVMSRLHYARKKLQQLLTESDLAIGAAPPKDTALLSEEGSQNGASSTRAGKVHGLPGTMTDESSNRAKLASVKGVEGGLNRVMLERVF
ncbi:MAG: RNA polymerase subunit sigma [Proteobacteria bacterium]|nr:MAG: RNA polymerase subunit sigma [Pseudomonadota bacterium]